MKRDVRLIASHSECEPFELSDELCVALVAAPEVHYAFVDRPMKLILKE